MAEIKKTSSIEEEFLNRVNSFIDLPENKQVKSGLMSNAMTMTKYDFDWNQRYFLLGL